MISKCIEQRNLKKKSRTCNNGRRAKDVLEEGRGERSRRASRSSRRKRAPVSFWTRLPRTNGDQSTFQRRPLGSGIKERTPSIGERERKRGGFPEKIVRFKFSDHSTVRVRRKSDGNLMFIFGGVEVLETRSTPGCTPGRQ